MTLDAALTQTALILGVAPIGIAGVPFYRSFVIEPLLPADVMDVGTRSEPNLELLLELDPELVIYSPEYGPLPGSLPAALRTAAISIYVPGKGTYFDNAVLATQAVGERIGRAALADCRIADVKERLRSIRLSPLSAKVRSVCLLSFLTNRHVRLYTRDSLFGGVLQAAGIRNAVELDGNRWGFTDIGITALASYDADLCIHIGDIPARASASPVWNALPFVRAKRIAAVPTIWMFGGLPSATRFADGLVRAIEVADVPR